MSKITFGSMSLREFHDRMREVPSSPTMSEIYKENQQMLRHVQRGVFNSLWVRVNGGVQPKTTRTYGSVRLLAIGLFAAEDRLAQLILRLSKQPLTCFLRGQKSYEDDIKCIVMTDGSDIYLLLSNEALDAGHSSLMKHDGAGNFTRCEEGLLGFVTRKDFIMEDTAEVATA